MSVGVYIECFARTTYRTPAARNLGLKVCEKPTWTKESPTWSTTGASGGSGAWSVALAVGSAARSAAPERQRVTARSGRTGDMSER
jgi:hypothetical protein